MSDKIKPSHLQRKAVLYVRQSSAYQVLHNQESQKLQYAMQDRLRQLGWEEIEVIDEDLGRSAAGSTLRTGFERMVAEVCLGKVGVVAAREVSRFARNSREWQQLVEVCRIVDTLLVDLETVYSPRQSNDRLLLGLKGSLNEYELDLLRQRSLEARHEKARRGELLIAAPAGFLKTEDQRLEKDPDRRVQEAIALIFRKFLELGAVRQTLLWFHEQNLQLPIQPSAGCMLWKRPTYGALYRILTHPAYGGAYAYGRTESIVAYNQGIPRMSTRRRPVERWIALLPHAHEGYIDWDVFQEIQQMVANNQPKAAGPGAPKRGAALLAGLLRCHRCGRKLIVHYTGRGHNMLRYSCHRGWLDKADPRCIAFGGIHVDEAVGRQILRAVQPAAVEAAVLAEQQVTDQQGEVLAALRRDLEAARYSATRAQKQFDAVDPENRLVADELERRWNTALARVQELEQRVVELQAEDRGANSASSVEFASLAENLAAVWHASQADPRLKKRIVRTLIEEVVADVDSASGEIHLQIHWKGGVHTSLLLPGRRRRQVNHTSSDIVQAVGRLAQTCTDDVIAGALNRNGLRTGRGNRWTRERVAALRSRHAIARCSAERRAAAGWLNLTESARRLGISSRTLRLAAERGEIPGDHPLPHGPWIFASEVLDTNQAQELVKRARHRKATPAVPSPNQKNIIFSGT